MAHQHSPGFLKIVEDAKKRIRETTIDDVKAKLDRGEKFLLIDVREESEYEADHLPGAVHLGKGVIERDVEARVPEHNTPSCSIVAGDFAPLSPPTTCKRWATRTCFPWMAEFEAGAKRVSPSRKIEACRNRDAEVLR